MIAPLLVLVLILAGLLLLAGCTVNVGLDTQVETDGSGTVSVRLAADQELQDALSGAAGGLGSLGSLLDIFGGLGDLTGLPGSVDELFDTILGEIPGEWEVERGTDDDGTKWLAMTRPFASPEELEEILASSALSSVVDIENLTLTRDEGVFSTKTLFSTTADVGGAMSQLGEAAVDLPLDLLGQVLVIENRLTLPGTIGDNNADEVQGNTLVWNVGTSGAREMHAESVAYNWAAIVGIIVAGGIVIAALVVALVLIILRRRRPSSPTSPPQDSVPGEAPAGSAPTDTTATPVVPSVVPDGPAATLPREADTPELLQPTTVRAPDAGQLPVEAAPIVAPPGEVAPVVAPPVEAVPPAAPAIPAASPAGPEAAASPEGPAEPAGDLRPPEPPLVV